jgi:outer membrane protein TolC
MMKYIYIICCFSMSSNLLYSQDSLKKYLTFTDYLSIVKEHHPVAYQANLKLREGDSYLQKAKSGFDPKLTGSMKQKYFDGKKYYSYLNGGLKVPTWFGIETELGYNDNEGLQLNPESYLLPSGVWNLGVSVNLGSGLFIDQRRADLKQAKIIQNSSELTQKIMLNKLILDATITFLEWHKSYEKINLASNNLEKLKLRYLNIKESVRLGDKPAIDTVKLSIQLLNRELKFKQAVLYYKNKTEYLNTFLWQDGFVPLETDIATVPKIDNEFVNSISMTELDVIIINHPEYLMAQNDISVAKIDYRIKKEELKPELKLKYNALSSDKGSGVLGDYSSENYYWGASMSYSIFTRKERANVELSRIKLEDKTSKLANKKQKIKYKVESTKNSINSLKEQVQIQRKSVELYTLLLESELTLFDIGESSLFLVNTREQNLIDSKLKLIETQFIYRLGISNYRYHIFKAI